MRPWTPPVRTETGLRFTVKRCCNGCGIQIGDTTIDEIMCSIEGLPLPDVRSECPLCTGALLL